MDKAQFLISLLDTIPDSIVIIDPKFIITYCNNSFSKRFPEKTLEDIVGKPCKESCQCESENECIFRKTMETRNPVHQKISIESSSKEVDIWDILTTPICSEDGEISFVVEYGRELTKSMRLESQLIQVDKMASIGAVTAGLAHEINNPLGIILGYTQNLIASKVPEDILDDLKVIEQEVMRCSKIVRDLMTFARNSSSQKSTNSLREIVETAAAMVEYQLRKQKIKLEIADSAEEEIFVDKLQFQQVFLNLFLYRIPCLQSENKIQVSAEKQKHGLKILVEDNGEELDSKVLEEVFNSTPLIPQKGILSLTVVKRIVEEHLGTFEISTNAFGTRYQIFLPKT